MAVCQVCTNVLWLSHMSLCLSLSLSLSKSGSFKVFVDSLAHSAHLHFDLASMSNLHVKLTTFMSFTFLFYFYFAILEWLVRFFVRARRFGMTRKCTGRGEGCGVWGFTGEARSKEPRQMWIYAWDDDKCSRRVWVHVRWLYSTLLLFYTYTHIYNKPWHSTQSGFLCCFSLSLRSNQFKPFDKWVLISESQCCPLT